MGSQFRIADTFTASLGRLAAQEQKAAKLTAINLQLDPSSPGLSFHKLDRVRDANFWSVRVNADIRLIVHRSEGGILLCYADHHDGAYRWAERRKIERHPSTGAMQMVVIPERDEALGESRRSGPFFKRMGDVPIIRSRPMPRRLDDAIYRQEIKPLLFDNLRKLELMSFGVPEDWVDDVRKANEDTLFDIIQHLPQEAQEALLKLAVGEAPARPEPAPVTSDPYAHPDAQRRFRVVANVDELRRALDFPWEKWAVFLHPAQQQLVERKFAGPTRVSGSAGTGKTIVAIHRAVHLARANPAARVLLTTFSKTLAASLRSKVAILAGEGGEIGGRITVKPITAVAYDLHTELFGQPNLASQALVTSLLAESAKAEGAAFALPFLLGEWNDVVDAWQITTWPDYASVQRLGRKTRIGPKQREVLWRIFERVRLGLEERKTVTWPGLYARLAGYFANVRSQFDHAVVDEAQDLSVAEVRFLTSVASGPKALFFAGDLGQRIFQQPFSWKALGIGCARPLVDLADQLPHLAPDQSAGRPAAALHSVGCGWSRREPARDGFGFRRTATGRGASWFGGG